MKAASGELNLTVITLIAIAAVMGFFWIMWPNIKSSINPTFIIDDYENVDTIKEEFYEKGLDENYNLIVDRTPKMNFLAKSTPELILKRIYEKSDDDLKVVYARILEKF